MPIILQPNCLIDSKFIPMDWARVGHLAMTRLYLIYSGKSDFICLKI